MLPLLDSWQRWSRELTTVVALTDDDDISVISEYPWPALLIRSRSAKAGERLFQHLYAAMPCHEDETEPMMNIVAWRKGDEFLSVVFPRAKHRPDCYGDIVVSPGAIDMAGLIITPREEDFRQLTEEVAVNLLREVSLSKEAFSKVI